MEERELKNSVSPPISLFLLGCGHRAMLFHLGAIWRLNELGLLRKIVRVSSVSGGSIVAGRMAAKWTELDFSENGVAANFEQLIADPCCLASVELESWRGIAKSMSSLWVNGRPLAEYQQLTNGASLANLREGPEFIFQATNLQTGGVWRFCKKFVGDNHVGTIHGPDLPLAKAITASASLPPRLPFALEPALIGPWSAPPLPEFANPELRRKVVVCDGSLSWDHDFEVLSKDHTLLVSDAGAILRSEPSPGLHWLNSIANAVTLSDFHIYERRKREWSAASVKEGFRGAYWDMAKDLRTYGAKNTLDCPVARTKALSQLPTEFRSFDGSTQKDLIDWGYASCDAAVRGSLNLTDVNTPDASPYGSYYKLRAGTAAA